MSSGRILFLYENESAFVTTDLDILRTAYRVDALDCSRGVRSRQVIKALRKTDMSFSWFALGYAARAILVGKVLGRPSVVVSGGWDVLSMPEIGYGAVRSTRGRMRARLVLRRADRVLAFSEWSRERIRELSGRDADTVYLGVDTNRFRPCPKEDLVVTVGNVTRENFKRKGLTTFVRAAAHVPEANFVLAGRHQGDAGDALQRIAPPNVSLTGWLPDEALLNLLARAKVYVQASYNEGFGLALAEAMACGCVPVVTREGALPEVAGDVGLYVPFGDTAATGEAILKALGIDRGAAARERIASRFSLPQRKNRLLAIAQELLGG